MSKVYIRGVLKSVSEEDTKKAIKDVLIKSTDNLAFLKKGDLVLLKPALNSPDPYPATTHPLALSAVAEVLKERGARVIAGDQSGVEHVILTPDIKKGSSSDNYRKSGMASSGVDFKAFEDRGYEDGYRLFNENVPSWPNGFYITKWVDEVDHIMSLPRVSTHAMAGATLGLKNMVGILRDDSRAEFHADGPYSWFFKSTGIKSKYKKLNKFTEKIAEINLAIAKKLRVSLFVATEVQTTFGPDKKVMAVLKANKLKLEEGLVFASSDMLSADLFALGLLTLMYRDETSFFPKICEKISLFQASSYHKLGKESPRDNRFIKYASKIGLGSADIQMDWDNVGDRLKDNIVSIIN